MYSSLTYQYVKTIPFDKFTLQDPPVDLKKSKGRPFFQHTQHTTHTHSLTHSHTHTHSLTHSHSHIHNSGEHDYIDSWWGFGHIGEYTREKEEEAEVGDVPIQLRDTGGEKVVDGGYRGGHKSEQVDILGGRRHASARWHSACAFEGQRCGKEKVQGRRLRHKKDKRS